MDLGLWQNKKCLDEIRSLDWIALTGRYWLVIKDWLSDIDWPDHLTCESYFLKKKTPREDQVNKGSNFTHSAIYAAPYRRQWVKTCHIFGEQVMITLVMFLRTLMLISFNTFMGMVMKMSTYFNNQLILCYFKVLNCFLTVVHPYARQKSPSNVTPPFQ